MTREELIKTFNMIKYPIFNNGYEQYKLDNIRAMEQNIENAKFDQMINEGGIEKSNRLFVEKAFDSAKSVDNKNIFRQVPF
jgi:hypothetical protein